MKTVYSDKHRLHDPKVEFSGGRLVPGFEIPRWAEIVLARVEEQRLGPVLPPDAEAAPSVARVHDAAFVAFLETGHAEWREVYGDGNAIPATWIGPAMRRKLPNRIGARFGYYCFDAATAMTATSWPAAEAGAAVALTAQRLVAAGERAAFALCRPPGHHAGRDFYGGYCFLNNAAVAAQAFIDGAAARVAVLDVDFHHGNGTQEIFYRRADVMFCSLHGHPEDEYPYFSGFDDERGEGAGDGFNRNYPLRPGTAWDAYRPALADAIARIAAFAPDALVVSLGVDTFERDPISRFKLKSEDYLRMGGMIAGLKRPSLFVMEGGYAVEEIGLNAVNVLTGFEQSAA
ncbi:MAG: histone deacetylase family protein [Dongiaceae bacterium]